MDRERLSAAVLGSVLVLSLVAVSFSPPASAEGEYAITIEDSIDTPTRNVEVQGATYEVPAIAKANEGDSMDVNIQAPVADQFYRVYLFNSDQQIVKGGFGEGNKTVEFELSNLTAGTYVFVVQEQGANQVVHPLVIKGYETSIEAPKSAVSGGDIRVNVAVERLETNITYERIEVVLTGQGQQVRTTAVRKDGTHTATINTQNLTPGSYNVYANVRGEQIVLDEQVIFGVSDTQTLRIETTQDAPDSPNTTEQGQTGENDLTTSSSDSATESLSPDDVLTPANQSQQTTDTKLPVFGTTTAIIGAAILALSRLL